MTDAMRVLSLFSGVGGMDLGLERSGMQVVGMCEIDKHARSVLAHHWPDVPIHDDVTTLETEHWRGRVDLVAGGSPCQDLSVAGRRQGLDGARSGLFWHQCRVADQAAAPWVLWENVAGALTSNNGADFAAVLWGLTGTLPRVPDGGWRSSGVVVGPKRTAVWRLLDAQYFGVAQRRRRVFVVAGAGGECRLEILLESESVCRDSAPSRRTRSEDATTTERGSSTSLFSTSSNEVNVEISPSLDCGAERGPRRNQGAIAIVQSFTGDNLGGYRPGVGTLRAHGGDLGGGSETLAIAIHQGQNGDVRMSNISYPLACDGGTIGQGYQAAMTSTSIRRLTPIECERLMSWPDDWTRYRHDGKEQADSHRYKQCGNGVVSNVAEWIGRRIIEAHKETTS
jgi:DNA (cytosine-5)-methyltransferase 1